MTLLRAALTCAGLLVLSGCLVSEYTGAEAPKAVTVDTVRTRVDVRFAAGSPQLVAGDAARLRALAVSGAIAPRDRIIVAAAGGPELAKARVGAIGAELLAYGIIVDSQPLAQVPPNQAIIEVARALVRLPPCPNWSKTPGTDFTNAPSSNFGCADAVNLGMMVAYPSDLETGRPIRSVAGQPSAAAMTRYLEDKVQLPAASGARAFSAPAAAAPQGGQQ